MCCAYITVPLLAYFHFAPYGLPTMPIRVLVQHLQAQLLTNANAHMTGPTVAGERRKEWGTEDIACPIRKRR